MPLLKIRNHSKHGLNIAVDRAKISKPKASKLAATIGIKSLAPSRAVDSSRQDSAKHLPLPEALKNQVIDSLTTYTTALDPQQLLSGESFAIQITTHDDTRLSFTLPTSSDKSKFASREIKTENTSNISIFYFPTTAVLSICPASNPASWMKHIPGATSLSTLSIPGTHNSATYHHALPSVRCQAVSPLEQLRNGVRFFDIRLQCPADLSTTTARTPSDTDFALVHGVFPISLKGHKHLRPLLDTIRTFLAENPSETVILCLKREGRNGAATDQDLSSRLYTQYYDPAWWYTDPQIPSLAAVRGKLVLMRRFFNSDDTKTAQRAKGVENWGLDANGWAFNTPNATCGHVTVQDVCELPQKSALEDKTRCCIEHLQRARGAGLAGKHHDGHEQKLFIGFLSASNLFARGCWPEDVAAKLNPAIEEWLLTAELTDEKTKERGENVNGVGIVVCDWVGRDGNWDLVKAIIGSNQCYET